ncbi:MAG TPA: ribonucleoside triphosphate reductase [Mesotoga sp.]|nr:ribonucleoside triphosphate reductase [Mesotoga sp.]NLX33705.1 ribonucleoside triphosphate reductase [Thermotogaceae bacterium]MDD4040549.1 ribonucleoside triphosphate reductase [Mesotoga sp.]MDD5743518.1 ribonucleoside triphosphate reductase [Mesotoga sp.]HPB63770.1 ribonucleoside triphosphate reductase [Mesotoga sp.]
MLNVRKRNGSIVEFDLNKIINAMKKAFDATRTHYNEDILERVALRVVADFQPKVSDNLVDIEDIQDSVERTLENLGFAEVAKAYILYRTHREKLRELKSSMLDFSETVNSYLNMLDWRVRENSTVTYSIGGLILHNSGTVTANYWLREMYDPQIGNAHREGDIHIHDLSMLSGYCAGWSLRQLIEEGLGGVRGKVSSSPARHLSTLVNQMVNFLGILQNEWAGAQAFSSFDTYLAPFVKIDNLSLKEVKQNIQSFVFGVNTPSRWGTQAPFTNVTLDWTVPKKMRDEPAIVGGKRLDFTYGDCQEEMDMINRAFLEILDEGDANGRGFQYPIPTYNITKDFDWENENAKLLFEITSKYGTPYFQNFINSDLDPDDVRSMCCRLQLDKRELKRRGGGLFGSDEFTGSIGVVTINLPRISYLSKNETEFLERLSRVMELASRSLEVKRSVVEKLNGEGLYPYTRRYLKNFDNHFSTVGLVGMNEACLNARWIGKTIAENEGYNFSLRVLDFMRNKIMTFQETTGHLYNLEATPAESTSYRLAKIDKKKFPQIITAGKDSPYYTNSSHLPVDFTSDIFSALDLQETLQQKYTGGTVFHAFLGEKISDWQTTRELVRKIAGNYRIPYFTLSPTYSVCQNHGYLSGEQYSCPKCGAATEVYSRITGYYRPVQNWNIGKQEEFKRRRVYQIRRESIDELRRLGKSESGRLSRESSPDGIYLKL